MRVTAIETIRQPDRPAYLWLQIHTDEGLIGLGEAQRGIEAVDAILHGSAAAAHCAASSIAAPRRCGSWTAPSNVISTS